MAYTVDILNKLNVEGNGLLSKIQIGGKIYEIKDLIARNNIETLSAGLDKIAGDLAGLSYVEATGQFANDTAIKNYVDSQVGAINKFDVHVMAVGEELPTAGVNTMYILYLKPDVNAEAGAYLEYITVRSGAEGAYTYTWEQIGSTEMDVTGFVTETALNEALKPYAKTADLGDLATKNEAQLDLKALAHKDSATGTVAGQTISGVKATGTSTGSITVELEQSEHAMNSTGKYTPAGNVTGTVKTAGSVAVTVSNSAADATLTKGDYTPAGTVSVALSGNTFNAITGVGTQASFTEGAFTAATLDYAAADYSVAKEGLVGSVEDECLTFTAAGLQAISASKINGFNGGSKASDTFVANSLPTMAEQNVGIQSATFTGTLAEDLVVTNVSYAKANTEAAATFTGDTVDIAATFAGTEGDISVAGKCHDYAVKTAEFVPAAIELAVGDIAVAEKAVTVQ